MTNASDPAGSASSSSADELTDGGALPAKAPVFSTLPPFDKPRHNALTRRILAITLVALLVVLYCWIVVAFTLRWIDGGRLAQALAAVGGVQTLAAAVVGFYFGSRAK